AKARLDATNDCQLNLLAAFRLVFWHWMQPSAYALLLYAWSDDPYFRSSGSSFQIVMALAVLIREVMYFLCTSLALVQCPAFLLVDVPATWRSGARGEAFASVMMPEKFLGWYLQGAVPSQATSRRFNSYCGTVLVLDGCSFLALWAGLAGWTARPPLPIMVCYTITALSLLAIPSWAFAIIVARAAGFLPDSGAGRRSSDALDVPLGR
ncbi:SLC4A10, partial [Symbiodinium pilosum]